MTMKKYFLCEDCELILEEKPKYRVLLAKPETLKGVSADEIWKMLLGRFGKYEVETWLAEEIVAISMHFGWIKPNIAPY